MNNVSRSNSHTQHRICVVRSGELITKKQSAFLDKFGDRKQHVNSIYFKITKQNTAVLMNSKIYKVEVVRSEWQQFH